MPAKKAPAPRQARIRPTLQSWVSSEENKAWLKNLVHDPRFAALLSYAQDLHYVRVDDLIGPKACLDEVVIRKSAIHAGVRAFEDTIRNILTPVNKTTDPEAWEHVLPPTT